MLDNCSGSFPQPQKPKMVKLFPFEDQHSSITLYVLFSVFRRMRRELGFEAMLEYMDFYQNLIEKYNPQYKSAVSKALDLISVEKIYADAMKSGGPYEQDPV